MSSYLVKIKKLQRYKSEKQSINLYENKQTNKKILKKYANIYININDDEEKYLSLFLTDGQNHG